LLFMKFMNDATGSHDCGFMANSKVYEIDE